jgi:hypothetical protein
LDLWLFLAFCYWISSGEVKVNFILPINKSQK